MLELGVVAQVDDGPDAAGQQLVVAADGPLANVDVLDAHVGQIRYFGIDNRVWKTEFGNPVSQYAARAMKSFEDGEELFSAIYDEADGLKRKDFCTSCWEEKGIQPPFSFWKVRIPKEHAQKISIDLLSLKDVLLRLSGRRGGEKGKIAYLLALILLRKKTLYIKDRNEESMRLVFKGGEEEVTVFPENIPPEESKELKEKLERLFQLDEELLRDLVE